MLSLLPRTYPYHAQHQLLRSQILHQRLQFSWTSSRRAAASRPNLSSARSSPTIVFTRKPTPSNLAGIKRIQQIEGTEELYNAGQTLLYRAPKRVAFFRALNYTVAGVSLAWIAVTMRLREFDPNDLKMTGNPYFWLVSAFHIVQGTVLAGALSICLYRTSGRIHDIRLVKQLSSVFLQVSHRSYVPFVKHRVLVEPYNLVVDPRLTLSKNMPQWMQSKDLNESSPSAVIISVFQNTLRAVSRLVHEAWAALRQFTNDEGLVTINLIEEKDGQQQMSQNYTIDTQGIFPHNGKDKVALWDIVTINRGNAPR